jgi:hypothetical protein
MPHIDNVINVVVLVGHYHLDNVPQPRYCHTPPRLYPPKHE